MVIKREIITMPKKKIPTKKRNLILDEAIQNYIKKDFILLEKKETTAILTSQKDKKVQKGCGNSYGTASLIAFLGIVMVICSAIVSPIPGIGLIASVTLPIGLIIIFLGSVISIIVFFPWVTAIIFTKETKIKIVVDDYGEVNIVRLRK